MNRRDHSARLPALATLMVAATAVAVPLGAQTTPAPVRPQIPLGLDLHLPVPEDKLDALLIAI